MKMNSMAYIMKFCATGFHQKQDTLEHPEYFTRIEGQSLFYTACCWAETSLWEHQWWWEAEGKNTNVKDGQCTVGPYSCSHDRISSPAQSHLRNSRFPYAYMSTWRHVCYLWLPVVLYICDVLSPSQQCQSLCQPCIIFMCMIP